MCLRALPLHGTLHISLELFSAIVKPAARGNILPKYDITTSVLLPQRFSCSFTRVAAPWRRVESEGVPYPSRFFEGWEALILTSLVLTQMTGLTRTNPRFTFEWNGKLLQGRSAEWGMTFHQLCPPSFHSTLQHGGADSNAHREKLKAACATILYSGGLQVKSAPDGGLRSNNG